MTPAQKRLLRVIRLHDDVIRYDTRDGRKRRPLLALERAGLVEFRDDIDEPGRMWAWPKATADHQM